MRSVRKAGDGWLKPCGNGGRSNEPPRRPGRNGRTRLGGRRIGDNDRVDLAAELQAIYDSEINVQFGWFWDCGITIRLGDEMNGFLAEETCRSTSDVLPWLQEAIAHFYPDSTFAKGLAPELRERASRRLFLPPRRGARVMCSNCGAPNAAPGMVRCLSSTVRDAEAR